MTSDNKITEYKELQHLRDLWSTGMGTWGQIFIPLGAAILSFFIAQYLASNENKYFLWIGWGLFSLCMIYWRVTVRHIDQQIVSMYPRMLELERELDMEIQASYYYRNLNQNARNRLAEIVDATCEDIKNRDYRKFRRHVSERPGSPHYYLLQIWDEFVLDERASWEGKVLAKIPFLGSVNYSVKSRGHLLQNILIFAVVIALFPPCLFKFVIPGANYLLNI